VQDRYRGGGGGGGGRRYGGGRRRRGRGGSGRPHEVYPDVGLQEEEHVPWAEDYEREPNPDADPLHLAYDSVYTHEGDIREELLEAWVEASGNGKRWRCWNCNQNKQRFAQLRLPTLRTVVSICDNCATWTVWDAWRDLANPRIFNFRRTYEEMEPASTAEPGPPTTSVAPAVRSNGSGSEQPQEPATPVEAQSSFGPAPSSPVIEEPLKSPAGSPLFGRSVAEGEGRPAEPSLELSTATAPGAQAETEKPKRTRPTRAKAEGETKPRTSRSRAKKADEAQEPSGPAEASPIE
jgi:hypothetical protein